MGGEALQRLEGDGARRAARDLVAGLGLGASVAVGARPRVVADMVATVDGRAAVQGRSVALGHPADRALLRELRTAADAILVGSGTLAAERYANLLDDEQRARRVADGRPPHPLVVTLSRELTLPLALDVPLFDEPGVPIVVFTYAGEDVAAPVLGAELEVVRLPAEVPLLASALVALGARGVRSVLCEGGPTLLARLVLEGGLDDLLLTVSPLLAAGDAPTILDGAPFAEPARLALRDVHRADDHVFLHYGLAR
ncbi:RibD family protein [Baekduia sp.]|uniref:RibD family protein n=1 Tax=Baekduia sp. TaxID=2600305 RepID=UPI002E06633A|nr:dihydrofolate reductase family protein [Baekduia sp.]